MTCPRLWIGAALTLLFFGISSQAKTFQNSYISFEVPDDWTCAQEGVAWTCTPQDQYASKEAVIVLVAKIAGAEDNLSNFLAFLKVPKKITTKVGTPMPSQVMYAQERMIAGHRWIQAQHLGSEIPDFYTLYLATIKDQLAILVSFSAEKSRYQRYNPIFDQAIKTVKIIASSQLLFPKNQLNKASDVIGIQVQSPTIPVENLYPPAAKKPFSSRLILFILVLIAGTAGGVYLFMVNRKKNSRSKSKKVGPK